MENAYNETMFILKKYNISASKSLGQNFLIDDNTINGIITAANVNKDDLIIEIGPGLGTLTKRLLDNAGKVIAIELDDRMIKILNDRFALYSNFELINQDVLKIDLNALINSNDYKTVKIVANLPYYITTPIIMKLLEDNLNIESITVMVQKEVAQRICSNPGEKLSGAITYSVNYYCKTEDILLVPNSSFIPSPEVNSEVIKLTLRKEPPVKINNKELFFKIIKASFMQRRKTLINGLSNSGIISKENCKKIFSTLNISEQIRGENLSLEDFANIANEYDKLS